MESDGLFSFITIYKFGNFKSPFATITGLSKLSIRFGRLEMSGTLPDICDDDDDDDIYIYI